MYAPTSLTSCCTALLHVLFQNPAALVLLGLIGVSTAISVEVSDGIDSADKQCLIHVDELDFAKGPNEKSRLDALTAKALQSFDSLPTGSPSKELVSKVLRKIGASLGGACSGDESSVMANSQLLRKAMMIHFLDIVSTSKDLQEAVEQYKRDTGQ